MREERGSHIFIEDIYSEYVQSCRESSPCSKVKFGTMVRKFYSNVSISTAIRCDNKRTQSVYKGLARQTQKVSQPSLFMEQIHRHLPSNAMLKKNDNGEVIFSIPSDIVSNGSLVMKTIQIVPSNSIWYLHIRGKVINLESVGVSSAYNSTMLGLQDILEVATKIMVCRGVALTSGNKVIPSSFRKEFVSSTGNENSGEPYVRSAACSQCINWSNKTHVCIPCQKGLSRLENVNKEINDEQVSLCQSDQNDLATILEKIFPNSTPEMKEFLQCQHNALQCGNPRGRRWPRSMISVCLNMWARSRRSYADLKDSNMMILPSGRQLQRYKNAVPQSSGLSTAMLHWSQWRVDAR